MIRVAPIPSGEPLLLHRMDPRLKLSGFSIFLLATALLKTPAAALTALFVALGVVRLSRIPLAFALRRAGTAALFLSTFFLILPFSHPAGKTAGVSQALLIVLKGTAMVLTIFPMFWTAPLHRSLKALVRLRLPPRLVTLLLLTFRYVQTYEDRLHRLGIALKTRGYHLRRNWKDFKVLGGIVGLLLLRAFEQTERIYQAMLCRGYDGNRQRFDDFDRFSAADGGRLAVILLVSGLLVVLDLFLRGGGGWIR